MADVPAGSVGPPHRILATDPHYWENLSLGKLGLPKVVRDATTSPTATDDRRFGFSPGSVWADVTNDDVWVCLDSTPSAAIWRRVVASGITLATAINAKTLASDKFTLAAPWTTLTSESGTADNLSWITGGRPGLFCFLTPAAGHTLTVKHLTSGGVNADRIATIDGNDFVLASVSGTAGEWALFFHASVWIEILRHTARDHQASIEYVIDGGGSVITTGEKGHIEVPFDCVLEGWTLVADVSGSVVIDIWKDTYANFPPTVADTIVLTPGTDPKPTLSSQQKNQDLSVATYNTAFSRGDILAFNVDSATTVKRVTLSLRVRKK